MKLRTPILALAFAAIMAASSVPAYAVAPKDEQVICDLKAPLDRLMQLKSAGTSSAALEKELEARKALLHDSMDCNAREATAMANAVSSLKASTRITTGMKSRYAKDLLGAAKFAEEQRDAAAAITDVAKSKDIARDLRTWRSDTYNPLAWEAAQLIVLDRNLTLARSAADRLSQLQKAGEPYNEQAEYKGIQEKLDQASTLITDSTDNLEAALELLRKTPKNMQEAITSKQKEGLDGLSQAYKLLLDIDTSTEALKPKAEIPAAK